jgi:hypothetical protein
MARGHGGTWHVIDPFNGLDESVLTSNVVSTRFAFDLTVSHYTTSGTTSWMTWEISNASGIPHHSTSASGVTPATLGVPEDAWSQWTSFGSYALPHATSKATTFDPPLGYRWARVQRSNSGASHQIWVNRLER